MRASLQFELPDEEYVFECSNKGFAVVSDLEALHQSLRSYIKHGHNFKTIAAVLDFVHSEISVILGHITVEG